MCVGCIFNSLKRLKKPHVLILISYGSALWKSRNVPTSTNSYTPAPTDVVNWSQAFLAPSALLHILKESIPFFICGRDGKKLKWMFLLIANTLDLLEVKAEATMHHPFLMHGSFSDKNVILVFHKGYFSEKWELWHSSAADWKGDHVTCYGPAESSLHPSLYSHNPQF